MRGTLSKAWWLLALCGVLDVLHAGINLLMIRMMTNLPLVFREFGSPALAVREMGILALAAGACLIAATFWSGGKEHSWLLSLHGLALGAFGAICVSNLVKGSLSFRPVSVLFAVMAVTVGAFALESARIERRGDRARWFAAAAGAVSMTFAVSFLAVGFLRWRLEPPVFFTWMAAYFVLCAAFLLWLALRVRGRVIAGSWLQPSLFGHHRFREER